MTTMTAPVTDDGSGWLYHPPTPLRSVTLTIVGCGGTGSHLTEAVVAMLAHLTAQVRAGRVLPGSALFTAPVALQLVDPDEVEPHNVGRQLFTPADVGRNKAEVLATRYGRLYGLPITFHPVPYRTADPAIHPSQDTASYGGGYAGGVEMQLLVGCVDNTPARREMHRLLGWAAADGARGTHPASAMATWPPAGAARRDVVLVDCGNERFRGQVLAGSAVRPDQLRAAFPLPGVCTLLPAPGLVQPELLLLSDHVEAVRDDRDCATRVLAEEQSLLVNRVVATAAATLIYDLLTGGLRRFGVYCDAALAEATPLHLSPRDVAGMVGLEGVTEGTSSAAVMGVR